LANIKSQIKRNRQSEKRRRRNRVYRGAARTAIKDTRSAIQAENVEEARTATLLAISRLDKAAQKGTIHRNNAARRKSRLMERLAALVSLEGKRKVEPEQAEPEKVEAKAEAKKTTRAKKPTAAKKTTRAKKTAGAKKTTAAKKVTAKKAGKKGA